MEQVRNWFAGNHQAVLLTAAAIVFLLAALAAAALMAIKRNKKQVHTFEPVPAVFTMSTEGPDSSEDTEEDDPTRRLFPVTDIGLKTYELEFTDADDKRIVYQIPVSDRIVIGRKGTCNVSIPNPTLSGKHCEIILKEGKLFLRDLGSLNGTFLNGSEENVKEEELTSGSKITMGQVTLIVMIRTIN